MSKLNDLKVKSAQPKEKQYKLYDEHGSEARLGIGRWIKFYNETLPHSKHGGKPPNECYDEMEKAA